MKSSPILILCAAALAIIPPAASFPTFVDRHPGSIKRRAEQINQERADAVKEAFKFAWDVYRHNAYPNDELRPVSNTASNSRNGWGATAVDSMSTAIIMELPEIVDDILEHISGINYSNTETMCSLFETTIRYLGGMLSAYDLLTGPHAHLASSPQKVDVLLEQSRKLADVLKFAFDTRTGIPANGLNITAQITDGARTNGIATIGTLVLEWTRLSDLTGNPEYARLTQHAESYLLDPQPSSSEPFPGLIGRHVNLESGLFEDDIVDWGGGSDSFYEYLLKMYVYDKKRFGYYKDRWVAAAESTIKHLKFSPAPRPDLTFVGSYSKGRYGLSSGHLNCFNGGNFLLGGQVLGRSDFKDFGLKLVEGCYATYNATASRIGPEGFGWDPQRVPNNQREFYNKNGFYITQSYYDLRPEVIESIYYAYRMTKDPKYQDWAWDIFVAINETTRTGTGFSSIADVNNRGGGRKLDRQESFLFAEVMKYSYLIHAPESEWQIAGPGQTNKYVYNTEAHPVKVFGAA